MTFLLSLVSGPFARLVSLAKAFFATKVGQWTLIILTGGIVLMIAKGRWEDAAVKEDRVEQKEIDHEKASDIRDAVDNIKPMRDDDLKFRD